jgi:hypothetical protein
MSDENDKPGAMPFQATPKLEPGNPARPVEPSADDPAVDAMSGEDPGRLAPQLRALYEELLQEPIPDRFIKLLDELERKESDGQ